MDDYGQNRPDIGIVNSKKTFEGGYYIELNNEIMPKGKNKCNLIFGGFKKEVAEEIMNSIFVQEAANKWKINDKLYFMLFELDYNVFEFYCYDYQ